MEQKDALEEIKRLIKDKRLLIGTDNTLKKLKINKLEKVWLSSNCPSDVREDIAKYAETNNTAVISLELPNDELGVLCKKQFPVSVLSLLKVKSS